MFILDPNPVRPVMINKDHCMSSVSEENPPNDFYLEAGLIDEVCVMSSFKKTGKNLIFVYYFVTECIDC